jgi:excisionase family DNA binding protein
VPIDGSDFDDLLKPREAAALLGVRTTTVARWARDGVLKPAVQTPGGHRRYRRGDVLAARTATATSAHFEEDAVRLYEQGWSIRRVAAEFEVGYGAMRRLLLRRQVLRERGEKARILPR